MTLTRPTSTELKRVMRDSGVTALLGLVAVFAAVGAGWVVDMPSSSEWTEEEKINVIRERDIVDYAILGDAPSSTVVYAYRGEPLPERLADDEDISLRTESSYTRDISATTPGIKTLTLIAYPQQTFVQRDNQWYYLEYDTTTKARFDMVRQPDSVVTLFFTVAHALSTDIFSGAGDGSISANTGTWAGTRDATSGSASHTLTSGTIQSNYIDLGKGGSDYTVIRVFLPFDTSSIPFGSNITATTLNVYVTGTGDADNDGNDYLTLVQTSQATHTALEANDFDNIGTTEGIDSGERKDITNISSSAYLTFTLNATGRGWVNKLGQASNCTSTSGITCIGLREGHDMTNTAPDVIGGASVTISLSEETGTSQDPYLAITYTPPFSSWQFDPF